MLDCSSALSSALVGHGASRSCRKPWIPPSPRPGRSLTLAGEVSRDPGLFMNLRVEG